MFTYIFFRLCVRNLPLACDSEELKKEFKKHADIHPLKFIEAKIMRSQDRKDKSGGFRSLGFGFIEVDNHENALKLLRATNNNPEIFGEKRRPIVEFSVENMKALKILEAKKKKLEQMKLDKEPSTEQSGNGNIGKGSYDFDGHKAYKAKAKEKRQKRNLRYQKKRQEKQTSADQNSIENFVERNQKAKSAKEENTKKISPIVKKPNVKNIKNERKRPAAEAVDVSMIEKDGQTSQKRSRKMNTTKKEKEESKFNSLVSKYKSKLNANDGDAQKKKTGNRWFEWKRKCFIL